MNAAPLLLKKELKIKSDKNNDYNVEIFIDSNSFLNIIIKNIDKTLLNQYNGKYSLDEMKTKNKYFLVSESISEAFYLLEPNLNNNSLKEKKNKLVRRKRNSLFFFVLFIKVNSVFLLII